MSIDQTIEQLKSLSNTASETLTDEEISRLRDHLKIIHTIYRDLEAPERTMVLMMALSVEAVSLPLDELDSFVSMVAANNQQLAKLIAIRKQLKA